MLVIIADGSLEKIKSEIAAANKQLASDIKGVKSQIRTWTKNEKKAAKEEKRMENNPPKEFDQKLMQLEGLKKIYESKMLPVQIGDILIDFATYQKAMKKLEGFEIDIEQDGQFIILQYKHGKAHGAIHFHDLSPYFKDFKFVPKAMIGGLDYGEEA
jgi:hypothetical protein